MYSLTKSKLQEPVVVFSDRLLYEWLAHTGFSKIALGKEIEIHNDGELVSLDLIELTKETRQKYIHFALNAIAEFSEKLIQKLETTHSGVLQAHSNHNQHTTLQNEIANLKTLQTLKKTLEKQDYKYLEL